MKHGERIISTFKGVWDRKNIVKSFFYLGSACLLFLILYMVQSYNYVLFHSIAEIISALSSFVIFNKIANIRIAILR